MGVFWCMDYYLFNHDFTTNTMFKPWLLAQQFNPTVVKPWLIFLRHACIHSLTQYHKCINIGKKTIKTNNSITVRKQIGLTDM